MPTYRFEELLGVGGFGEVYLARRTGPRGVSMRVAVKVLRADVASPSPLVARLRDEAAMLAAVDHPVVVRVIDLIQVESRWALVTEYIDGVDLSRVIHPARRLPERAVGEVAGQLAGALRALHAARLVHRDLKPSNVRISRHGDVKLLDFGIARSEELDRLARTQTGMLPFTLGYTPPEAFTTGHQGPPTDVFALGITVYRALCGAKWYGLPLAEQASVCGRADRYAAFAAARLADLDGADPSLVALVAACVAYDPAARPTAAEIEAYVEDLGLPGPSLRSWARGWGLWDTPRDPGPLSGWVVPEDRTDEVERAPVEAPAQVWWPAAAFVAGLWALCLALVVVAVVAAPR